MFNSHFNGRTSMRSSFENVPADKVVGKPKTVAYSTFKYERPDGTTVYRLHTTDILEQSKDGRWKLNSGGWKTSTTKSKINEFLPGYSLYADKGVWTVIERGTGRKATFFDGMVLPDAFAQDTSKKEKEQKQLIKDINGFVKKIDGLKELPLPSNGDCWYCLMHTKDGQSWGDKVGDAEHLESHIHEGYLHGSLLVNAMRWAGNDDRSIQIHYQMRLKDRFKTTLRRYLKRKLGVG